jgi:HK97 gp10 family phage protein
VADTRNVKGADQICANLRSMTETLRKRLLRKSVVAGAYVVRDAARSKAPVRTGRLRDAIIIKLIPERTNKWQVTYYVVARSGKRFQNIRVRFRDGAEFGVRKYSYRAYNGDAFYWRFVEFGTARMSAQPFMRPAFAQNKEKALGLITLYLREGIDQSVRAFATRAHSFF